MKYCLFLGDSITDANHLFSDDPLGDGFLSLIGKQLMSLDSTASSHRTPHSLRNFTYHLSNQGQDGFTTERLWRMLSRNDIFGQNTPNNATKPSINWNFVTILIGVNDIPVEVYTNRNRIPEEYETYYRLILDYIQSHSNAKLILIEPFLFDQPAIYKSWQTYIQMESQIIQKLAIEYDALFVSTHTIFQEACTKWGTASITPDGIHLTDLGNQLLANLWLAALDDVL